jgi:hypothetical protein
MPDRTEGSLDVTRRARLPPLKVGDRVSANWQGTPRKGAVIAVFALEEYRVQMDATSVYPAGPALFRRSALTP